MKTYSSKRLPAILAFGLFLYAGMLQAEDEFLTEEDLYGDDISSGPVISDPLEPVNRSIFKFNDFALLKIVQPVADGYEAVTPDPVEEGASNFFYNLKYPVRLAGNLLQGRLKGAGVETGRFVINTGFSLGFMTPADDIEMLQPIASEDVGQALGSWGIAEGPYLVLPFFGPSNLRDLGGLIGDRAVNPMQEPFSLIDDWNWEWRLALAATEYTVDSPSIVDRYLQLKGSAIDPYSSLKNGYTQFRRAAIEE